MAWPSACLLVQASTSACEEKAQSFQKVVSCSTNTATIVCPVNEI